MANLSEIFLKQETLETLLKTVQAKGVKGVSLTISMNDEANEWGQNVQSYVSQTKEDREAKKPKFWTGSGKVFWADGKAPSVVKKEQAHASKKEYAQEESSLPF
jgi:proline dehydrogenase